MKTSRTLAVVAAIAATLVAVPAASAGVTFTYSYDVTVNGQNFSGGDTVVVPVP